MMTTKTMALAALLGLGSLSACGNGNTNNDMAPANDLTTAGRDMTAPPDMTAARFPAPPSIGMQIDRMGRPGVNTALTDPFWNTDGAGTNLAAHEAKQDAYNQASDPTQWATLFAAKIKASLGVYDALDQDIVTGGAMSCGNQLAYGALSMPDYSLLAAVLADDELYVNTNNGTCASYLGVEAATLGSANTDCGGRTPIENTIDITYAALAGTEVLSTTPLPNLNGVPSDADGNPGISAFPFLGQPNN